MHRFSLRDLFWLTLVVGMGCAWWMEDRRRAAAECELEVLRPKHDQLRHDARILLNALNTPPTEGGYAVWRIEGIECTPVTNIPQSRNEVTQ